jgi:hypothetical protein
MIQFNSVYVNGGQTVVTLFLDKNGSRFSYIIDELPAKTHRNGYLEIEVSNNVKSEILENLCRVWGLDELYVLKRFAPLSPEVYKTIMAAWAEVRRKEAALFASK